MEKIDLKLNISVEYKNPDYKGWRTRMRNKFAQRFSGEYTSDAIRPAKTGALYGYRPGKDKNTTELYVHSDLLPSIYSQHDPKPVFAREINLSPEDFASLLPVISEPINDDFIDRQMKEREESVYPEIFQVNNYNASVNSLRSAYSKLIDKDEVGGALGSEPTYLARQFALVSKQYGLMSEDFARSLPEYEDAQELSKTVFTYLNDLESGFYSLKKEYKNWALAKNKQIEELNKSKGEDEVQRRPLVSENLLREL